MPAAYDATAGFERNLISCKRNGCQLIRTSETLGISTKVPYGIISQVGYLDFLQWHMVFNGKFQTSGKEDVLEYDNMLYEMTENVALQCVIVGRYATFFLSVVLLLNRAK